MQQLDRLCITAGLHNVEYNARNYQGGGNDQQKIKTIPLVKLFVPQRYVVVAKQYQRAAKNL
jgi:hypothetical protein